MNKLIIILIIIFSFFQQTNASGDIFFSNNNFYLRDNIIIDFNKYNKKDYVYNLLIKEIPLLEDENSRYRLFLEVYNYLEEINNNKRDINNIKKLNKEIEIAFLRYEDKDNAKKDYDLLISKISPIIQNRKNIIGGDIIIKSNDTKICGYKPELDNIDLIIKDSKNINYNDYKIILYEPTNLEFLSNSNSDTISTISELNNLRKYSIIDNIKVYRDTTSKNLLLRLNKVDIKNIMGDKDIYNFNIIPIGINGDKVFVLSINITNLDFLKGTEQDQKDIIKKRCNEKFIYNSFNEREGKIILNNLNNLFLTLDDKYGLKKLNSCIEKCDNYNFESCSYECEKSNEKNLSNYANFLLEFDNLLIDKLILYNKKYDIHYKKSLDSVLKNHSNIERDKYRIMLLQKLKIMIGERIDGYLYKFLENSNVKIKSNS